MGVFAAAAEMPVDCLGRCIARVSSTQTDPAFAALPTKIVADGRKCQFIGYPSGERFLPSYSIVRTIVRRGIWSPKVSVIKKPFVRCHSYMGQKQADGSASVMTKSRSRQTRERSVYNDSMKIAGRTDGSLLVFCFLVFIVVADILLTVRTKSNLNYVIVFCLCIIVGQEALRLWKRSKSNLAKSN